jgi:Cu-Zn family superoxide dismutase
MRITTRVLTLAALVTASFAVQAQTLEVPMNLVDAKGGGPPIGIVTVTETAEGVVFTPKLDGLPPGLHGFHVHENPTCDPAMDPAKGKLAAAQAAGGHLDPDKAGHHEGPMGKGHLGDLPALKVGSDGKATTPVVAPRLKLSELSGHSLMIHAGGDNYSDTPQKLGGGGERIACGVI